MASSKLIDNSGCTKKWRINALSLKSDCMYTDVTLVPKDQDQRFHCHRIVLASASTYFKNLFHNANDVIYLTDDGLSANILKILIDYMYKAEIRINLINVIPLNQYSDEFGLEDLHNETNTFLENNIKSETCLKYWRHAKYYRNEILTDKCIQFIKENPDEFFEISLNDLKDNELETICTNLQDMKYDSLMLTSISTWVNMDFGKRKFKLDGLLKNINTVLILETDIIILKNDPNLKNDVSILKFISKFHESKKN